jgi:hypothetical protein
MKSFQNIRITINILLTLTLLTGCQNDSIVVPGEVAATANGDKNAKIAANVLLVKDGENSLQYLKLGKFAGKLWRVSNVYSYTEYTYDDSSGDLWITSKTYAKSNNKLTHHKTYHIVNGLCVASKDLTNNFNYKYKYNVSGSLAEVTRFFGAQTLVQKFSYQAVFLKGERLDKITHIGASGPFMEYKFTYSPQDDKYPLNPTQTELDKYLRIFGTFSDKLVQNVTVDYLNGTASAHNYTYTLNGDGYVTTRTDTYYPDIYDPLFDVSTDTLSYVNSLLIL